MRACPSESSAAVLMSTPIRRIRGCWATRHERPCGRCAAQTADEISTSEWTEQHVAPDSGEWRLLRRIGTRLGDLAILHRSRAGDADGPDNLAIRDEGNAALERRCSAQRERAHTETALRH
jgi:hypothetical protein